MSLGPIKLLPVEDNPGDANLLRLMPEETVAAQFEIALTPPWKSPERVKTVAIRFC